MKKEESFASTDEKPSNKAFKAISAPWVNAGLIGFAFGIIIYSITENTVGLFTLIPLYFIYKIMSKTNNKE